MITLKTDSRSSNVLRILLISYSQHFRSAQRRSRCRIVLRKLVAQEPFANAHCWNFWMILCAERLTGQCSIIKSHLIDFCIGSLITLCEIADPENSGEVWLALCRIMHEHLHFAGIYLHAQSYSLLICQSSPQDVSFWDRFRMWCPHFCWHMRWEITIFLWNFGTWNRHSTISKNYFTRAKWSIY